MPPLKCAIPFQNKSNQFGRERSAFEERTRYRISYYSRESFFPSTFPLIEPHVHVHTSICCTRVHHRWNSFGQRTPPLHRSSIDETKSKIRSEAFIWPHVPLSASRYRYHSHGIFEFSLWVNDHVRNPARCNISFMCRGKDVKVESLSCLPRIWITRIRKNDDIFHLGYIRRSQFSHSPLYIRDSF